MSTYPPIILQEAGVYNRAGAYIWWRAHNSNLGGARPVDLWLNEPGNKAAVLEELSRLTEGFGT